jgi:hypothetical protein
MNGRAVARAQVGLLAGSHAVDDIYQGAVPTLLPFFIAGRHYSYVAATGLTFAVTVLSSVIQPVFGALTDRHDLTAVASIASDPPPPTWSSPRARGPPRWASPARATSPVAMSSST